MWIAQEHSKNFESKMAHSENAEVKERSTMF